jgi:ABC-2 type transport system permease protein
MNIWNKLKKYLAFGFIGIKETVLYPVNLTSRIVIHLVRVGAFILVYKYFIEQSPDGTLGGLTLVEAGWSVALVQLVGQSSRQLYSEIRDEIKTGAISSKLDKPYDYILSFFSKSIIEGLFKLFIFLIFTGVFLYIVLGIPDVNIKIYLWIAITLLLGLILHILTEIIIGLTSFWIGKSDPIYRVVNRSAWVINGMMVPVALLPAWAKTLSTYYPFSIPFVAGRAFESDINYLLVIFVAIVWVIILYVITRIIFNKAQTKLTIHGG